MSEGIYKFTYSTTIQAGLLGQDFTTEGSGILVFQANQIIGFVNEGKNQRFLEGSYTLEPATKREPRRLERFNCKLWSKTPIPGTFGEQWQSDEEKNFKLEMIFHSESDHGDSCIAIIPRGEVHFKLNFLLGFQCRLKLNEEETQ